MGKKDLKKKKQKKEKNRYKKKNKNNYKLKKQKYTEKKRIYKDCVWNRMNKLVSLEKRFWK